MASDGRPVVDVGVVTWNTRDLTVDALRRLLDSEQGVDVRVLVHDNASEDGTPQAIARLVPEADVVAGTQNLGFAAGVNRLLDRSDAPWFFLLNSDAWPEPGCLSTLVAAAQRHPAAALTVPRVLRPGGELEHSTYPFPSLGLAAVTATAAWRVLGRRWASDRLLEGFWRHDVSRPVDWAVGAAWLLRRAAVAEVGGLDERFFMYAEDLDWCWRAAAHGWQVWFEPAALVRHVGNASGRQRYGRDRTTEHLRNSYDFYRRTHGRLSAGTYRVLNLVATSRLYLLARLRGDRDRAGFWADHARVHLSPRRPSRAQVSELRSRPTRPPPGR